MNINFIKQAAERAIKTAAQSLVALLAAKQFDWMHLDWKGLLATVGTATLASVATSVGSLKIGPADSPSVVPVQAPVAAPAAPPAA